MISSDKARVADGLPVGATRRRARILVLDALDKMLPGATHEETVRNIREIRASGSGYEVVIVTARGHFFRSLAEEQLRGMTRIHLQPLSEGSVLSFADRRGLRESLAEAMNSSSAILDMARKPLLLHLLLEMLEAGDEISGLSDYEDLYAHIIDPWLVRDIEDSIIPNKLRLKCMQCLAVSALGKGGKGFKYETIDELVGLALGALTDRQKERFNTDLRVCGFLHRIETDVFEFQHASFYEYCVARTVFEDIKNDDFLAFGTQVFTQEVIEFIERLVIKAGRKSELTRSICAAWKGSLGDKARVNILKLATRLAIPSRLLPVAGMTFGRVSLDGVEFRQTNLKDVTFRNCNFSGCVLIGVEASRITMHNCLIQECQLDSVQFALSKITDTDLTIKDHDSVEFLFCNWLRCNIAFVENAAATIHGGTINKCKLSSMTQRAFSGAKRRPSTIRFAELESITTGDTLASCRIEECSSDEISLFALSQLPRRGRPSLSRNLLTAVGKWNADAGAVAPIRSPHARPEPDPGESLDVQNLRKKPLSQTQKRRRSKAEHQKRLREEHPPKRRRKNREI